MLRIASPLRTHPPAPCGDRRPPLIRTFAAPPARTGDAAPDPGARLARVARLGPRFTAPAAVAPVQRQPDGDEDFSKLHDFMGAKQQGKVSIPQGKSYPGPIPMRGKRSDQVTRHFTNLVLNRLTHEQGENDPKHKPVEVQMSMVGGHLLLSTNDPQATRVLHEGIKQAGGPLDYVRDDKARNPAMDKDKERPKRYLAKLNKALAGERHWQDPSKRHSSETDEDVARAQAILAALRSPTTDLISRDRPDDENLKALIEGRSTPRLHLVEHAGGDRPTEHAERIQTKLRAHYLADLEKSDLRTAPTGPKTTCLGCSVFHKARYPTLAPNDPYTGAYFGGSSPVETEDRSVAIDLLKNRPSTGSISQQGYVRNSDYPDSDSDEEGGEVLPRPVGYQVSFGGEPPKDIPWLTKSGERMFRRNLKRTAIQKRLTGKKRARSPSPPPDGNLLGTSPPSGKPRRKRIKRS